MSRSFKNLNLAIENISLVVCESLASLCDFVRGYLDDLEFSEVSKLGERGFDGAFH
jgi:hypothetical protein